MTYFFGGLSLAIMREGWLRDFELGRQNPSYLLVLSREEGNTVYKDYLGIIFPYSLLEYFCGRNSFFV